MDGELYQTQVKSDYREVCIDQIGNSTIPLATKGIQSKTCILWKIVH